MCCVVFILLVLWVFCVVMNVKMDSVNVVGVFCGVCLW